MAQTKTSDTSELKHYDIENIFIHRKMLNDLTTVIQRQLNDKDPYPLNINELRNFFYYGYGTENLRAKAWQIFLNYFIKNKFKSEKFLFDRRGFYEEYRLCSDDNLEARYYDDIIEDDMTRKYIFPIKECQDDTTCEFLDSVSPNRMLHRDVMKRILVTFRKTNSSIGYVQGMCNILMPIYYVFATGQDEVQQLHAEEDAYFCFFNLMSEIGDFFVKRMDDDKCLGIKSKMDQVFVILKYNDLELFLHLKELGIIDSAFHFKWVSLLLTLEFNVSENIWLWDRFLSDCNRFEIVLFCCVAILIMLRDDLLSRNFDEAMNLLQDVKNIDPQKMLSIADNLRKKHYKEQNS